MLVISGYNGYIASSLRLFLDSNQLLYKSVSSTSICSSSIDFDTYFSLNSPIDLIYLSDPASLPADTTLASISKYHDRLIRFTHHPHIRSIYYLSSTSCLPDSTNTTFIENPSSYSSIYSYLKLKNQHFLSHAIHDIAYLNKVVILKLASFVSNTPKANSLFHKIVSSNQSSSLCLYGDYCFNEYFLYSLDFNLFLLRSLELPPGFFEFILRPPVSTYIPSLLLPSFRTQGPAPPLFSPIPSSDSSPLDHKFYSPTFNEKDSRIYWIKS